MPIFHGDLTEEKFYLEWFGLFGRELGTNKEPHRKFTDDPNEFLAHIKMCIEEKRPCWITVQPMRAYQQPMAIEKLFFDFDDDSKYCSKCDKYMRKNELVSEIVGLIGTNKIRRGSLCPICKTVCIEKPRTELIAKEVSKFITEIEEICKHEVEPFRPTPLIVKTYKGFHVYLFLTETFKFDPHSQKEAEELYELMQKMIMMQLSSYEFLDTHLIGGLTKFGRVPLTPHEKSGAICEILKPDLTSSKVRSLEYYRAYGIPTSFVKKAIKIMKYQRMENYNKEKENIKTLENEINKNGEDVKYGYGIRPCFEIRMERGEANHPMRLAWLSEIFYNGYNTPEKMLELCHQTWSDFSEKISRQQIDDYFKHERYLYHPYKCSTIREKGWCLGINECRKIRENINK